MDGRSMACEYESQHGCLVISGSGWLLIAVYNWRWAVEITIDECKELGLWWGVYRQRNPFVRLWLTLRDCSGVAWERNLPHDTTYGGHFLWFGMAVSFNRSDRWKR